LRLTSESTAIDGRGEFSSLGARRGAFSATADPLDLDELLAILSGVTGSGAPGPAAPGAASVPLDVRLEIAAPRGRLLGIDFTGLATTLAVTRDGVTLEPFGVGVLGGTLAGSLRLDTSGATATATVAATVTSVDVTQLAALSGSAGSITGRLDGQVRLAADAGVPDTVFRTARGTATLWVSDGTVPGLDLVRPVILAFGKPADAAPSGRGNAFARLGGTFSLAQGVLRSVDLTMDSRDVDLRGGGTLRVAGAGVDVRADLVLSEELSSQAGRDLYRYAREGSRIVLPATVTGPLASPSVSIDLGAALQRAARNALEDELKKGLNRLFKR
jgi:hypothetical protein